MVSNYRTVISENKMTDRLDHAISVSDNESIIYLKVSLSVKGKSGVFSTEKSFRNNIFGLEDMQKIADELNTEEKVEKYFGIFNNTKETI